MAAELSFQYSPTHLQNLAETKQKNQTQNHSNPMQPADVAGDDDSWEVRAFAEDTANVMGTTWPPRSYTCTYCRREFRSAQALGGHMNVHRRDRARLQQPPPKPAAASLIIPPPDFASNGGLCFLYHFPNSNDGGINDPTNLNAFIQSPASLFNNLLPSPSPPADFLANDPPVGTGGNQEVDLELRLGQGPSARSFREEEDKICEDEAACLRKKSY